MTDLGLDTVAKLMGEALAAAQPGPLRPTQVALYLKAHNAEQPCGACGNGKFTMHREPDGETGQARGVVTLACDGCNALRIFLRPPIVAWLKESRCG
jgi:hypothetical protein